MIDIEKVRAVINSDTTAYEIEKQTGISRSQIGNYRSGKHDIMNMTLNNALKLQNYIEGEVKMENHFIKKELGHLFTTEEAAIEFANIYWNELKDSARTSEIDTYGWDSVADDISHTVGQMIVESGDFVEIEISSGQTKSGNPELILVGELVDVPTENEDGDYDGDYKFK